MNAVSRRDLVALALGLTLASWLVVRVAYGELAALRWWLPVPVGLLALAEAGAARAVGERLRAQRERRPLPGGGPVAPLLAARLVVLAQASAYVGAVLAGCWAGVLLHTVPALDRLTAARGDTVTAVLGVLLAVALAVAALWLEHVCKVPLDDDDPPAGGVRA